MPARPVCDDRLHVGAEGVRLEATDAEPLEGGEERRQRRVQSPRCRRRSHPARPCRSRSRTRRRGARRRAVRDTPPRPHEVLLAGEEDDADGPPRHEPRVAQQAQRFHDRDASRAVVGRALAHVPRIDVRAEQHDLVRKLSPAQLADDVGARRIRQRARAERELDLDRSATRQPASRSASSVETAAAGIFRTPSS